MEKEDEFMKQYMETCKEQIEKLAKDPELLNQTLKPFMQMSQQLMAGGLLDGSAPAMIPDSGGMDINKMIAQIDEMINYIKNSHKEIIKSHNLQDDIIQNLDESSRKLRSLIKKLIKKISEK